MSELRDRGRPLLDGESVLTLLNLVERRQWRHRLLNALLLVAVAALAAAVVLNLQSHHDCKLAITTTADGTPAGDKRRGAPNAHLTGSQGRSNSSDYVAWERERGDAHLHLFAYDEARRALVVPRDGRYSVYLQATYRAPGGFPCDGAVVLEQLLFVWSDSYREDVLLLRGRDSVACGADPWTRSLHTAGTFSLLGGDRLRVKVAPVELVEQHEKGLFFGAFLVAEED